MQISCVPDDQTSDESKGWKVIFTWSMYWEAFLPLYGLSPSGEAPPGAAVKGPTGEVQFTLLRNPKARPGSLCP
jgi:hypothetical protein